MFDEGGKGVLDILGSAQDGKAVGGQGFGIATSGGGDFGIDAAEVEQPPTQSKETAGLRGLAAKQSAEPHGCGAKQPAERKLRIIFRDGGADPGIACGQGAFGGDDVRTPAEQGWRSARARHGRWAGDGGGSCELWPGRSWLKAEQDIQRVHGAVKILFKLWNGRLHLRQCAFRLAELHLRRDALAILQGDQIHQLLLGLLLAAGDVEPRLKAADHDVGVGRLRCDGEPCRRRCCGRCLPVGPRRVTRRILAAEKVEFPARAGLRFINLALALKTGQRAGDLALGRLERLVILARQTADLTGREKIGPGAAQCGARLRHAGARLLKVEVLRQRPLDHACEQRIVERQPPVDQIDLAQLLGTCVDSAAAHVGRR